jgi:hypothetical protein
MARWLVRKDLVGDCVAPPLYFAEGSPVIRKPGVLTLEEFAAQQLAPGECLRPESDRYWIDSSHGWVGYFELLDSPPPPTRDRVHRSM